MQTLGYQALAYQVFLLLATVSECFQSSLDEIIPPKITSDWQEYFSETSYAVALPMFLSMAGEQLYCYTIVLSHCLGLNLCLLFCPRETQG